MNGTRNVVLKLKFSLRYWFLRFLWEKSTLPSNHRRCTHFDVRGRAHSSMVVYVFVPWWKAKRKCIFEFGTVAHRHATKLKIYLSSFGGRRWLYRKSRFDWGHMRVVFVLCVYAGTDDDLKLKPFAISNENPVSQWHRPWTATDCYTTHRDTHTRREREKKRGWRREKEQEFYNRAWDRAQTELVEMSKKIIYHFLLFVCIPSTASVVACRLRKRNKKYIFLFRCGCCRCQPMNVSILFYSQSLSIVYGSVYLSSLHTNVVLTIAGEKRTILWSRHLNVRNVD